MGEAKRRAMVVGPTGNFPDGVLTRPGDQGELVMAVSDPDSNGIVHIDFGVEVSWIGLPRDNLVDLCRLLLRKAGAKKVEIEF